MMNFKEFLNERKSQFKYVAKYSSNDFTKWKLAASKAKSDYVYDVQGELELIYNSNNKHIATYNSKKHEIWTDDLSLFGN